MTLLSRKADYALLILSYLSTHGEGASAREVAEHFGLSRAFVANILKELCQGGFVISQRGVKGGYSLQRPAEEITLGELLTSLEEGFQLATCNDPNHGEGCSLTGVCPMRSAMAAVHRRILDLLNGVTLAELFPVATAATSSFSLPLLPPIVAVLGCEQQ